MTAEHYTGRSDRFSTIVCGWLAYVLAQACALWQVPTTVCWVYNFLALRADVTLSVVLQIGQPLSGLSLGVVIVVIGWICVPRRHALQAVVVSLLLCGLKLTFDTLASHPDPETEELWIHL